MRGLGEEIWGKGMCTDGKGPARPVTSLFEEEDRFLGDDLIERPPASRTFLGSFTVRVGNMRVASDWVRVTEGSFRRGKQIDVFSNYN